MDVIDLVGNTPLIEFRHIANEAARVRLLAKAEFMNPSGSVKDRAARGMLLDGIARGSLVPGKTIIDATSGNTGVAYAMIGAALGYPVVIYLPQGTSPERKRMIRYYGASIVETDPLEGSDGSYLAVREEIKAHPGRYFYPDQYNNPANPAAHVSGTGAEIWTQTGGEVTHFITGMGTSGTFMGVSRKLKQENPSVKTLAVQPDSPFHGIDGVRHVASSMKPGILDEAIADGIITVTTELAYEMTRRLAKEEGLFVGVSSGANVAAALTLAKRLEPGAVIVTILCDGGSRYLSDSFWNDEAQRIDD
ncbi:MAG: cysteine synthase family protein [Oscillospiraceae bacterium]|nr:cysteine synthase family protein [Oscillospiraceae bacterium]